MLGHPELHSPIPFMPRKASYPYPYTLSPRAFLQTLSAISHYGHTIKDEEHPRKTTDILLSPYNTKKGPLRQIPLQIYSEQPPESKLKGFRIGPGPEPVNIQKFRV